MFPLAATDTETTGLSMGSRIVELAGVLFDETGAVIDRFETLVNPGMPIPKGSNEVHAITDDMVKDAPNAGVALAAFLEWLPREAPLVIHNAPYDVGVINYDAQRCGFALPFKRPRIIDTLAIARERGTKKGNALDQLAAKYSLTSEGEAHRAMHDADICRQFFNVCHQAQPITKSWAGNWASYCTYDFTSDIPSDLAMLPDLVAEGAPIAFKYEDAEGKKSQRTITPYGWAVKDGLFYFSGNCHLRSQETGKLEIREFRADRVLQVFA